MSILSISDVITNSSDELFIFKRKDLGIPAILLIKSIDQFEVKDYINKEAFEVLTSDIRYSIDKWAELYNKNNTEANFHKSRIEHLTSSLFNYEALAPEEKEMYGERWVKYLNSKGIKEFPIKHIPLLTLTGSIDCERMYEILINDNLLVVTISDYTDSCEALREIANEISVIQLYKG